MKTLIAIFLVAALVVPCAAQKVERYIFAGVSTYDENEAFSDVKRGIGLRVGGGLQLNNRFGVELIFDNSPALDTPRAAELLTEEIDTLKDFYGRYNANIRIETSRNFYASVVGTLTLPVNDKRSWLFKCGLTYASYETNLNPGFENFLVYRDNDTAGFFSGGLLFRRNEHRSTEFSLTHTSGDTKATAAHVVLKHHF